MRSAALLALLSALSCVESADPGTADAEPATTTGTTGDEVVVDPCEDVVCDDGLACTEAECVEGACVWDLSDDACLIGGHCVDVGASNPDNPCLACDREADPWNWTATAEGEACPLDVPCIADAVCAAGECVGTPVTCDEGTDCLENLCDPQTGECAARPTNEGGACDGGPCLQSTLCVGGGCFGAALLCDDGDPCTTDVCDADAETGPGGCVFTPTEDAPCDDGDACTAGDVCDAEGECLSGPDAVDCGDDNECTLDVCDALAGCAWIPNQTPCCAGSASICDDGNPCTEDQCDAATVDCTNLPLEGPCDDGSPCTLEGVCTEGGCDAPPIDCDDGQPCTQDYCVESGGCEHAGLSGTECDDGLECSTGDTCEAGECVADVSGCECTPEVAVDADIVKVSEAQLGVDGQPGSGLDVDGDPSTCQPAGDCNEGVDNAFAPMAGLANDALQGAVDDGSLILILELPGDKSGEVTVTIHQGEAVDPECDLTAAVCDYNASASGFHPLTCEATYVLPATLEDGTLTAGGPGSILPFTVPLQGALLEVAIYDVRIEAELELVDGQAISGAGVVGGALRKDVLLAALDEIDPDALPIPIDLAKQVVESVLTYDIDTDGDGAPDAVSIGIATTLIDGNLVGVE